MSENVNPAVDPAVNADQAPVVAPVTTEANTLPDKPEIKPEDAENYKKGFLAIKKQAKEMEARLAEYARIEEEAKNKELKRKGHFDELEKTYQSQINELKPLAEQWQAYETAEYAKIPEDLKTQYSDITEGMTIAKQISFFGKIQTNTKAPEFGNNKPDVKPADGKPDNFQTAKSKWDIQSMLSNAPII